MYKIYIKATILKDYFFVATFWQQKIGYFDLLVRIQMAVCIKCSLNFFVTEPFSDKQRREAHFYKERGVAVPNIVYSDSLNS